MAPAASPGHASLPPSVEEAYRRKCIQLKKRMHEVEETNDAARVRIARLKRQIEKQRLERAFLLEQLAKRTSENVEDSDGSPSPPPTPKEKPLRTKRGHRKASLTGDTGPNRAIEAGSGSDNDTAPRGGRTRKTKDTAGSDKAGADGLNGSATKTPSSAFELYCEEMRPALAAKKGNAKAKKDKDGDDVDMEADDDDATEINIDEELSRGWADLDQADKDEFEARVAEDLAKFKQAAGGKDDPEAANGKAGTADKDDTPVAKAADAAAAAADVDMADGIKAEADKDA